MDKCKIEKKPVIGSYKVEFMLTTGEAIELYQALRDRRTLVSAALYMYISGSISQLGLEDILATKTIFSSP